MSFLSGLKSLFTPGNPKATAFPAEEYQGYTITPTPEPEGGQFRVCGLIEKAGKTHQFYRADLLSSAEDCAAETIRKAKLGIDQLGDNLFS